MAATYRNRWILCFGFLSMWVCACSNVEDIPYIVKNDTGMDVAQALAACENQEFLTSPCVGLLADDNEQKQAEQADVQLAKNNLNDFLVCYTYAVAEVTTVEGETATTEVSCDAIVTNVLAGFDVCTSLAETEKYYECVQIEEEIHTALDLCDASTESVSVDFCALVNPTTDVDV